MNNHGCYGDRTYCRSPNCTNECGRKMPPEIAALLAKDPYGRIAFAYFCDVPDEKELGDE